MQLVTCHSGNALHDRELRLLPPPDEVAESLMHLDDHRLALDELERLRQHAPSISDLEALKSAMDRLGSDARLGRTEEYWLAISKIPACTERMSSWYFIRTYRERIKHHTEYLQDLSDMFSSLKSSAALPVLIASILSIGNWLNSDTEDGNAVAFDLRLLGSKELYDLKGADGSSLQHWIFMEFFDSANSHAADLLEALSPTLQNVSRKVKDTEVKKVVRLTLEECDEAIAALQAELCKALEELQRCLEPLESTDPVKLRLQREFNAAMTSIDAMVHERETLKMQFEELLNWLQMTETRTFSPHLEICFSRSNSIVEP